MGKKYNIISIKEKKQKIIQLLLEAAVDPDSLRKVSEILKRELSAEKDNEDYNQDLISTYIDRPTLLLTEVGQKRIKPGDSLKIDESLVAADKQRPEFNEILDNNYLTSKYEVFPFTWKFAQELRSYFILKTEKSDSFDKLMDEIDGLIFKYMSIDDWIKIKSVIKKSEDRLSLNKLKFLNPQSPKGDLYKVSQSEVAKYGLQVEQKLVYEDKKDSHDLLSLKEFVSILKQEEIHPLTIGFGFFGKYMPEFEEAGYSGLVFKIEKNILKEIKLVLTDDSLIDFSPIKSAQVLEKAYDNNVSFGENVKYFVTLGGCVSSPEVLPLGYEKLSKNNLKIEAGETFLFEKDQEDIVSTRLFFVPYDYSQLHLVHQHGSVIYGQNDQSFHSCLKNENDYFDSSSKNNLIDEIANDDKVLFEPSFLAAAMHYLKGENVESLLKKENKDLLLKAMSSLFEETSFTSKMILAEYCSEKESEKIEPYLKNYSPLNKRFLLGKYFYDSNGLVKERTVSTYDKLSNNVYLDYQIKKAEKSIK